MKKQKTGFLLTQFFCFFKKWFIIVIHLNPTKRTLFPFFLHLSLSLNLRCLYNKQVKLKKLD